MASRSKRTPSNDGPRWWDVARARLSAVASALSLRQWLTVAGLVVVAVSVRLALGRMEQSVRALPEGNPAPRVELVGLPEWAVHEGWAPRFAAAARVESSADWLDPKLLERLAERLRASGWVREVKSIRKEPDGTIRVACDFRRPIGMVRTVEKVRGESVTSFVPIDAECVRLPERYRTLSPGWIAIEGVESPAPPVGSRWTGGDINAGATLATMMFNRPVARWIESIDVSNYHGRKAPHRDHVVLSTNTKLRTRVRWGSAPNEEIEEPTASEKLRNLEEVLQTDPDRAWIDVSVFPHMVGVPATDASDGRVAGNSNGRR